MSRKLKAMVVLAIAAGLLTACPAPTPQIVEKEVIVEKPVVETVVVEKEVVVTAAPAPFEKSDEAKLVVKVVGGGWGADMKEAYFDPFTADTGIGIVYDMGFLAGAILEAAAEAGNVEWDTGLMNPMDAPRDFADGLLDPIDYSKIDPEILKNIPEMYQEPWGILHHISDFAIIYRTDAYTEDTAPQTWADLWDVEKFPGARCLPDGLEQPPHLLAWLAMGVPPAEFGPITTERMSQAWAKLDEIKPHVSKWWASGGESIDVVISGEAVLGVGWSDRAVVAIDEGAPLGIVWNDHMFHGAAYWTLPHNSPHVDEYRYQFLNFVLQPERQADFASRGRYKGFSNTAFVDLLSPEVAAKMPPAELTIGKDDQAIWSETVPGTDKTWHQDMMEKWPEFLAGTLDY